MIPLMPQGVEHYDYPTPLHALYIVMIPLMPQGVEHSFEHFGIIADYM